MRTRLTEEFNTARSRLTHHFGALGSGDVKNHDGLVDELRHRH